MMNVGKWIAIGVLALPPTEILAFILVAAAVGLNGALLMMIASTAAGVMLLRQAGRERIAQLRAAVADGEIVGTVARGPRMATVAAGILLIIPGFVTDALGILLLVPAFRRWLGATIRHAVAAGQQRPGEPSVIDLEPTEWQRLGDRKPRKPRPPKSASNQADETG